MTSNYEDIYSRFLLKIQDYELANLVEADANALMKEWLRSSLSKVNIRRLFNTISRNEELGTMEYTLKTPIDDEQDKDFIEELLSHQLVVEWCQPKVKTIKLMNQMITNSKESKYYAQANHLQQLQELLANSKAEVTRMLTDRGFVYNSYLGNVT